MRPRLHLSTVLGEPFAVRFVCCRLTVQCKCKVKGRATAGHVRVPTVHRGRIHWIIAPTRRTYFIYLSVLFSPSIHPFQRVVSNHINSCEKHQRSNQLYANTPPEIPLRSVKDEENALYIYIYIYLLEDRGRALTHNKQNQNTAQQREQQQKGGKHQQQGGGRK